VGDTWWRGAARAVAPNRARAGWWKARRKAVSGHGHARTLGDSRWSWPRGAAGSLPLVVSLHDRTSVAERNALAGREARRRVPPAEPQRRSHAQDLALGAPQDRIETVRTASMGKFGLAPIPARQA
jgi:hypothetical protein